jgi:hypothetical protein
MGTHEKLLERFLTFPKDFTWKELERLLRKYGYVQNNKGKTSGSRVEFENPESDISLNLHKPHPRNVLKPYHIKDTVEFLRKTGVIAEKKEESESNDKNIIP